MLTPEALQQRIATVEKLKAVARTMEALSRATIRQYENAVTALSDYYRTVELGLHAVLRGYPVPKPPPRRQPGKNARGLILIGTDQGLCGRFNELVTEHALGTPAAVSGGENRILALGRRVADQVQERGLPVAEVLPLPGSVHTITRTVEHILLLIDTWQNKHAIHEVLLFYNQPHKRKLYRPHRLNLLPVEMMQFRHLAKQQWPARGTPVYTMSRKDLLAALLQQYFFIVLYRACAESLSCEHAARLAAMQRAGKNIDEHLAWLSGRYRQQRQNNITEELLDIVAGCEALRN